MQRDNEVYAGILYQKEIDFVAIRRGEKMITAKATEHLTGILLEGEYQDFYEMVESIYRMTGLDDDHYAPFWSIKNRLLGICYDIRHAFQGDRSVKLVENGVNDELMKWHSMVMPQNNLHYAVEIIFPEAVFVALTVSEIYSSSSVYYGNRARKLQKKEESKKIFVNDYADYIRDKAMLDLLSSVILSAFAQVIGDEEFEKIMRLRQKNYSFDYMDYITQYVDKCNIDYLKTVPEKRKDKIRNIARRIITKPEAYKKMKHDLEISAAIYRCSVHDLSDPKLKYPDEIEW